MRILSIDFDYFIDTDVKTRNNKFPDGVELKTPEENIKDWKDSYRKYPEIRCIGLVPCIKKLSRATIKGCYPVLISESHKGIYKVFSATSLDEKLEVVNIDFHHDNYISGGNKLDCANWLRFLMTERPDTKVLWVAREDSETVSLMGDFPYPITTDIMDALKFNYDYVFICFSPEWTPPHLRNDYLEFCYSLTSG